MLTPDSVADNHSKTESKVQCPKSKVRNTVLTLDFFHSRILYFPIGQLQWIVYFLVDDLKYLLIVSGATPQWA